MVFADDEKQTEVLTQDLGWMEVRQDSNRMNPRLVFTDPENYFGRGLLEDLWLEQKEQM